MKAKYEVHTTHGPLWERTDWRYAILMGGRGNGRSGTASRFSISQLLSKEYTRGAIMRAVREDIRPSCWSELLDRVHEQNMDSLFHITDNDMYIGRGQNSLRAHGFRASSGSLTARLKSLAEYNYVWIEEAEEIGEVEFRTLDDSLRTKKGRIRIVLTLNTPAKNHWLIKRWFDLEPHTEAKGFYIPKLKSGNPDALYIPGTWRENEVNLDKNTIERYQRYKETNPSYYWHLIEGLSPETVTGRIYQGWQEIEEIPHEARFLGYGLDFGYDPDPAAVVALYYWNGGYIVDEVLYQTRMLDEELATSFSAWKKGIIIADSAEPKAIEGLKRRGLNVVGVGKGKDSVEYGIKHVQGMKISYTMHSRNLKNEYENYAWKRTKDDLEDDQHLGVEDPACANHCMSALRYALTELAKPQQQRDYYDIYPPEFAHKLFPKDSANPAL